MPDGSAPTPVFDQLASTLAGDLAAPLQDARRALYTLISRLDNDTLRALRTERHHLTPQGVQ